MVARDPIPALAQKLLNSGQATPAELEAIEQRALAEVAEAVQFAADSPYPDPESLADNYMFA